jgi:hypothetical protein
MAKASPGIVGFNSGEWSPAMESRTDTKGYATACFRLENFIPQVQGPARRRPGTRFVAEVKFSDRATALIPFKRSESVAFIIEVGDLYMRFYQNHAQVQVSPGVPYEIVSPYAASDLYDSDNMFQLVFVESADVVYITHRSATFPAYKLSHFGPTHWTLAPVDFLNGPFADANPGTNPVVFADAQTGTGVTLTASSDIFDPLLIGAYFQLTQENIRTIRPWEPGVGVKKGARRRFNGVTYEALNGTNFSLTPFSPVTGSVPPTHLFGQAYDSGGLEGILWEYRDPGFGFVQLTSRGVDPTGNIVNVTNITAAKPPVVTTDVATAGANGDLVFISGVGGMPEVNDKWYRVHNKGGLTFELYQDDTDGDGTNGPVDGTFWDAYTDSGSVSNMLWTATGDVIQQTQDGTVNRLPKSVVFSQNATSNWAVGAFNNRDGYPTACSFFRGRLAFARQGEVFMSVASDFENYAALNPGGVATPDQAIHITLPTQDPIKWLIEGRVLVVGTEGAEHVIQEINTGQAFGPSNIASKAQMRHGSRSIPPVLIGYSLLWIQTSGQKLRIMKYQFFTDQYQSEDLAALANHIFEKIGCNALAYQQEPDSVIWMIRGDVT